MSVESSALVWQHSKASDTALVVLLAIANHDGEGGSWPSIATLVRLSRKSERTVQRAITDLVALGEIRVHVQQGGTHRTRAGQRPNRYELLLACPPECDRTAAHRLSTPVTHDTPTPVTHDTRTIQGTTPQPSTGDQSAVPESLARLWAGEGINDDEQHALWAMLVADPETLMPLHRGKQPAWIVWALAQVRAKQRADTGASVRQLQQYGPACEHGTPGGAAIHPTTGLPLCPLCRTQAARA